jgi:hypothetical protein
MPYQTLPPPQPVAGVQPGPGFYVPPASTADLKKMEVAGQLERDRRKEAATARHTEQAAAIQAQRDMRLAHIDAAHTGYQANVQAERDARQAGYADLAEQNAAARKAELQRQQNEAATEHAKLADQFEQGHQYRAAGYQAERDYQLHGYESEHQERAAELQSGRDLQLHGQSLQHLDAQQAGQAVLAEQQGDISSRHLDQQGYQQALLARQGQGFHQENMELGQLYHQANTQQEQAFTTQRDQAHVGLQGQLNQIQLTQSEQARMQRIRNQIGDLDENENLSPQERANIRTQLQTGLDPLMQRHTQSQMLTEQLRQRALDDAHKNNVAQTASALAFHNSTAQQRYRAIDMSDGTQSHFITDIDGRMHQITPARPEPAAAPAPPLIPPALANTIRHGHTTQVNAESRPAPGQLTAPVFPEGRTQQQEIEHRVQQSHDEIHDMANPQVMRTQRRVADSLGEMADQGEYREDQQSAMRTVQRILRARGLHRTTPQDRTALDRAMRLLPAAAIHMLQTPVPNGQ